MPKSMTGLRPNDVGELAVDRHGDRLGQQVDREQPRELGEAAEVARRSDGTAVAMIVESSATRPGTEHDRRPAPGPARTGSRRRPALRRRHASKIAFRTTGDKSA